MARITVDSTLPVGDETQCHDLRYLRHLRHRRLDEPDPSGDNIPDLPRYGMQMAIPGQFSTMTWFGRGPQETYWDRQTGAAVGLYSGPVEEQIHPCAAAGERQ